MTGVLAVALGAFAAACVQATAGLGFAMILSPILFAVMASTAAIATATTLGLVLNVLVLAAERRRPSIVWGEVLPILAAVAPGSACGVLLLQNVPKPVLQTTVGIVVICATVLLRVGSRATTSTAPQAPGGLWRRLSLGFVTGTLNTSTGINGPPLALWLSRRGLTSSRVRDSLSALFFGSGLAALVTLTPALHRTHLVVAQLATGALGVLLGHAIGSRAFSRLSGTGFDHAMLAVVLASGITSAVLGLSAI